MTFPQTEAELDIALNACQVSHAALTDDWNDLLDALGADPAADRASLSSGDIP